MKNIIKIFIIICIIIAIIVVGVAAYKYMQKTPNIEEQEEQSVIIEKYTPLERLNVDNFDLITCLSEEYYTYITSAVSFDTVNDFIVYNRDKFDDFIKNVNSNVPDTIRVFKFTINEKDSFLKDIIFTKDKFIVKEDYRFLGNATGANKKIITNEYSAEDYKLIVDDTAIKAENAKTYYRVYLQANDNSNLIYLCNYYEITENNESNFKLQFFKDETKGKQLILGKDENDKYDYDIYSYNGDVKVIIDNEIFTLRDALLNDKITVEEILEKAEKDVEKYKNTYKTGIADGGTVEYYYNDYIILKLNRISLTAEGEYTNKDMYIGDIFMDVSDVINM